MLHRIVGVGALYFILATVDAFVHVDTATHDVDNKTLLFTQVQVKDNDPFETKILDPIGYFGFNYLLVDFRELDGNNEDPKTPKKCYEIGYLQTFR